ncbi:nucleotide kinase domain-containing protein [Collinsella sp. Sow4_E3]|uniref:nucleotide kinase domain-containing protein n=1 Tax=Collinsella sp. Sow4_E3 TaxID=3438776 RepID=UPI003F93EFC6
MNVDEALRYIQFVEERHYVWIRRQNGASAPWTDDPTLRRAKFTNVYRVLDAGSQFLLTQMLQDPDAEWGDQALRAYLVKYKGWILNVTPDRELASFSAILTKLAIDCVSPEGSAALYEGACVNRFESLEGAVIDRKDDVVRNETVDKMLAAAFLAAIQRWADALPAERREGLERGQWK